MWMHSNGITGGGQMVGGMNMGIGMILFGLLYAIVVIIFLWLMYRGVIALESMAGQKDSSHSKNTED